ncbi:MAG TPA: hypothetical protein VF074_19345 [Pyrinomonadaceae bacterium]
MARGFAAGFRRGIKDRKRDAALDLSVAFINPKTPSSLRSVCALQKREFIYTKLWAAVFA